MAGRISQTKVLSRFVATSSLVSACTCKYYKYFALQYLNVHEYQSNRPLYLELSFYMTSGEYFY